MRGLCRGSIRQILAAERSLTLILEIKDGDLLSVNRSTTAPFKHFAEQQMLKVLMPELLTRSWNPHFMEAALHLSRLNKQDELCEMCETTPHTLPLRNGN